MTLRVPNLFHYNYTKPEKDQIITVLANISSKVADYEVIIKPSSPASGRKNVFLRSSKKTLKELIEETELKFMVENKTLVVGGDYAVLFYFSGGKDEYSHYIIPKEYWFNWIRNKPLGRSFFNN